MVAVLAVIVPLFYVLLTAYDPARPGSHCGNSTQMLNDMEYWLRYGFDLLPLYKPLTFLALGHAYEAAGVRDSATQAYTHFLRLWDKADPELQGRVREARSALEEPNREQPR